MKLLYVQLVGKWLSCTQEGDNIGFPCKTDTMYYISSSVLTMLFSTLTF